MEDCIFFSRVSLLLFSFVFYYIWFKGCRKFRAAISYFCYSFFFVHSYFGISCKICKFLFVFVNIYVYFVIYFILKIEYVHLRYPLSKIESSVDHFHHLFFSRTRNFLYIVLFAVRTLLLYYLSKNINIFFLFFFSFQSEFTLFYSIQFSIFFYIQVFYYSSLYSVIFFHVCYYPFYRSIKSLCLFMVNNFPWFPLFSSLEFILFLSIKRNA